MAPVRFVRPYYAFRPRLSLGFGLWAGFPIAYYDPYYYPYTYPYPYPAYGYPYPAANYPPYPTSAYPPSSYPTSGYPSASYPQSTYPSAAGTDPANTGGVSFEITPATAQIIVDGSYAGTVGEFGASMQPLGLPAGRHRIEIRAPGYQTMSFDAEIVVGQVIPYQGAMER